ncbi:MAG: hypothetical protein E6230_20485 [Paenibacillus dendritiformis]|uniref:hypothetical protein n=1 Tax=Paenibacillus dendritiformis TaxID=130049 RepID=UPI001B10472B|nr:hypothetical protein [Paenibacillus dendritiformis]MDU5144551.1 hypothetical protein [Paenibacillus dendritiformis]GIO76057.1 hypothetical protein J27TS7_55710 [Paenibacillus dendritiformis]
MRNKKNNHNKKNVLLISGMAAALLLSGCSSAIITSQIAESVQGVEESDDIANLVDEAVRSAVWDEVATEIEEDEDIQNIEWDDVKDSMAQRKQKIEVRSITDDSVLHTITDNQQIFEFTKNLHIVRWKYLGSIPKDAKDLLVYVTWSEKTKTVFGNNSGELYETSRNTLYKNKDGYYLVIEPEPSLSPVRKVYSKVPAKTAEYLLSLAGTKKK